MFNAELSLKRYYQLEMRPQTEGVGCGGGQGVAREGQVGGGGGGVRLRRGAEGDQILICLKKAEELLLFSTTN